MTSSQFAFADRLLNFFRDGEMATRADDAVRSYFSDGYTGSRFELMADGDPDRITSNDLVAVSMLGVDVPARVTVWLLEKDGQATVASLLRGVPTDVDIWNAGDVVERDGPLWQLWTLLSDACWPMPKTGNGMGMTTISKLLAAKRPRLVPIVDSVVAKLLPSNNYWADFATSLASAEARGLVLSATPSAPPQLSLLRRIDVVLWMLNH